MGSPSGKADHAGGQRRMGGGGNVVFAIKETGIGRQIGAQFHAMPAGGGVDVNGPGDIASVVEEFGTEGVDAGGKEADGAALVALGGKIQAIAHGAVGESPQNPAGQIRGDDGGQSVDAPGLAGGRNDAEDKADEIETAEGINVGERKRSDASASRRPPLGSLIGDLAERGILQSLEIKPLGPGRPPTWYVAQDILELVRRWSEADQRARLFVH